MSDNNLSETEKRKQIRTFFFPFPKPSRLNIPLLFSFTFLIIISFGIHFFDNSWIMLGLGLLWLGGGYAFFDGLAFYIFELTGVYLGFDEITKEYIKNHTDRNKLLQKWQLTEKDFDDKPSIGSIDIWLKEDMHRVLARGLDKLGLTRSELVRDPMLIYGPLFWTIYGIPDDELVTVKTEDGTLRFSSYQLVVVCLSAERIATYSANFNFLRNVFVGEKTIEFLYRDIVSVSTEEKSTNYNLPNGSTMRRAQVFRLVVPGDNIEVVINSPEIKELLGGEAALTDHDRSVRVIREMLRDKKG